MAKVVIVTSGQPSANPRVVKEATALASEGYDVNVIFAPLSPWADDFDSKLFKETSGIKWIRAGYHPTKQPLKYKYARLRRKIYEKLYTTFPSFFKDAQNVFILFAQELESKAKSVKADMYIGHNLGALPAAVKAAKKWNKAAGFDAEDYHRGEASVDSLHFRLAKAIEDKYVPQLSYLSAASPLIFDEYRKLYPAVKATTINNVFSRKYVQEIPKLQNNVLSLFWFSQKVGENRGLEVIVEALNALPELKLSLNILGDCPEPYKQKLHALAKAPSILNFISPVALDDIFPISSQYDIGMATEIPYCENRNVCLTNKLFTYLLAGNCILASDTAAQKQFLNTYKGTGLLYRHNNPSDLAEQLHTLYYDRKLLNECRENANRLASTTLNWEVESTKFLSLIKSQLN